jgi:hypothetical protein
VVVIAIIATFATALTLAQSRIAGSSHGDSLSEYELKRLREGKPPFNHNRSTSKR